MGVCARGACKNLWPLFIYATVEASNFKFGIQLGPKIGRGPGKGSIQKIGTPRIYFFAVIEASKFKFAIGGRAYNLGLGSSLPRNNFSDKKWRGSGLRSIEKN